MADFFGDLWGALSGETIPGQTTIYSPTEQINRGGAILPAIAQQTVDYERALAEQRAPLFRDVQAQLSPFARQSQLEAQEQILQSLKAPYAVDPYDVQLALQSAGLTGFGASEAGRFRGAEMFERGLRERRERAQERALSLGQYIPGIDYVLQSQSPYGPNPGILGLQMGREEAGALDMVANQEKQRQLDKTNAIIKTGFKAVGAVIGGVVGAYAGDAGKGAQAGYAIGGQIVPGQQVQGLQQQQSAMYGPNYGIDPNSGQNRNQWTSILSGIGGLFSGSGGTAGQRQTAYDRGGVPMNSYGA